ncbi:hypothetical protein F4859DRAFT_487406 [Xylaria cf. heliscus]|nr:hypothetical protein F4859DRAFT_487406 [Xylaria cf. heliscus]
MFIPLVTLFLPLAWGAPLETRQTPRDDCFTSMQLVRKSSSGFIDGDTALNCLLSLPFDATTAGAFLAEITKYIQFQSTLEVLKNPPDTYISPSVDILGGLDKISNTTYTSQYEFDLDITNLIRSANDGHFSITPCSLAPFAFQRQEIGLASVSADGRQTPDIYVGADVEALSSGSTAISPVTTINGQDVMSYLEKIADLQGNQDPDARWNTLFVSLAAIAPVGSPDIAFWGTFTSDGGLWPGVGNTTLEFKNGSTLSLATLAKYNNFPVVSSATALFNTVCLPDDSNNSRRGTPTKRDNTEVSPTATAGPVGFPTPIIRDPYNQISGYALDNETVVMFIPTFVGGAGFPNNQDLVFSETATRIVNTAIANGRTKLIIDLSRNPGGDISRAFDLFKLFFPSKLPYSATRFRRHDASDLLILANQKVPAVQAGTSPFKFQGFVNPAQDAGFASTEDFLKGEIQLGVNVTSLYANFNYTLLSLLNANDGPIRGFGGIPINNTQPYAPEDILIVTDGFCSSTCTTFVNLMTNVGGVRSLTFGGRPRSEPMQVMGGVRGAQAYEFSTIDDDVAVASSLVSEDASLLTKAQLTLANNVLPIGLRNLPLLVYGGGFNLRNAYQEGADHLPLQFDYQASDCRLFYTARNIAEPGSTWADARDAVWGDAGCVANSTGGRGSLEDRSKNNANGTGSSSGNGSGSGNGTDGGSGGAKDDGDSGAGSVRLGGSLLGLCVFASAFILMV